MTWFPVLLSVNNPMQMRSHRMTAQLEAPHMVSNCGKIGQPIAIQELNSASLEGCINLQIKYPTHSASFLSIVINILTS